MAEWLADAFLSLSDVSRDFWGDQLQQGGFGGGGSWVWGKAPVRTRQHSSKDVTFEITGD